METEPTEDRSEDNILQSSGDSELQHADSTAAALAVEGVDAAAKQSVEMAQDTVLSVSSKSSMDPLGDKSGDGISQTSADPDGGNAAGGTLNSLVEGDRAEVAESLPAEVEAVAAAQLDVAPEAQLPDGENRGQEAEEPMDTEQSETWRQAQLVVETETTQPLLGDDGEEPVIEEENASSSHATGEQSRDVTAESTVENQHQTQVSDQSETRPEHKNTLEAGTSSGTVVVADSSEVEQDNSSMSAGDTLCSQEAMLVEDEEDLLAENVLAAKSTETETRHKEDSECVEIINDSAGETEGTEEKSDFPGIAETDNNKDVECVEPSTNTVCEADLHKDTESCVEITKPTNTGGEAEQGQELPMLQVTEVISMAETVSVDLDLHQSDCKDQNVKSKNGDVSPTVPNEARNEDESGPKDVTVISDSPQARDAGSQFSGNNNIVQADTKPVVSEFQNKTKPQNTTKSSPVVVDDDDDDVVVLDDEPVKPKVEQQSSSTCRQAQEVLTNNNDMGIQIAAVSGGAEALHKLGDSVKQEGKAMQPFSQPKQKPPASAAPSTPADDPSTDGKKPLSKTQCCIVCKKLGKCKYNIVRNGDIRHLCDDFCFKRFRSNPSAYLKGIANKLPPASPAGQTPPPPGCSAKAAALPQHKPVKPAGGVPLKTCVVCQIMNINNQGQFCVWKGMDFCGEGCLGKFQSGISTACTLCRNFIPLTARSSNCLRLGSQIRPFCSPGCYSEYKVRIQLCTFCHIDVSKVPGSFSAPVGADGVFRLFCTHNCMKKFESSLNSDVEIIQVEQGKHGGALAKCSVCQKMEKTKHAVRYSGVVHNLCSDPCLSAFRYVNKLDTNACDYCFTICSSLETSPHTVVFEGNKKRFCSDACVSKYRHANHKLVTCSWCGSQRDNFDMIERLDNNSRYQLFCSLSCLSLFRVNLQAKSNQAVACDLCHKVTPAQYHLTMSDASVRNFCSYNCVMSFQAFFTKGGAPPAAPASAEAPPTPLSTSTTHKHNTRGKNKSVTPPASSTSVPIISNVISLAPQGSQTVNIKNSTGAPLVVSGGTPGTKTTVTAGSSHQQIMIRPPEPKVVKNKALMCKPITMTKATSCRPNCTDKECQTDESLREKPALTPIPVPIYLPTPMALYSAPAPTPLFIPIPIPVPVFIPTTRKSADGIRKHIKEIMERTPSDPLEAELLAMAAAVSEQGNNGTMDSESDDDDILPDLASGRKRPLSLNLSDAGGDDGDVGAVGVSKEDGGEEDMISMALRMAEEITDLESAVEAMPVNSDAAALADGTRVMPEAAAEEDLRMHSMGTRRSTRGGPGRPKRQRLQEPETDNNSSSSGVKQATAFLASSSSSSHIIPQDLNCHLKFTYGVNAWRHWVMFKNAQIEQNRKPEAGGGAGRGLKLFKADILQCTAEELNFSLCLFVQEVRKPNGEEYSPDSIYYLTLGLQQFLYENGRIDNIFADHYYEPFTKRLAEILSTCQPKFNAAGQMVCRIEEEHLWECKQLGAHSPYVLLNTLIYFHTKYFMLKTPQDHMKLSFAHIFKYFKKGSQPPPKGAQASRSISLRYYSVSSARKDASAMVSTTKRGSKDGIPVFEVVENQDNPLRCPVKLYEFFQSKCPESIKNRSDIFYPVPERSCVPDSPVWYSTQPLSEEVLTRMLTRILLVREIQEAHLHARPNFV